MVQVHVMVTNGCKLIAWFLVGCFEYDHACSHLSNYISKINIPESVDSVCRDTTYTQYMLIQKNLSKSQKRYTYKPL